MNFFLVLWKSIKVLQQSEDIHSRNTAESQNSELCGILIYPIPIDLSSTPS